MNDDTIESSTGIIAYGAPAAQRRRVSPYANSALIAQLLATYDQHPQARDKRRLDGPSAARAYKACEASFRPNGDFSL